MKWFSLFVVSALLGSFYDGFHTHSGATSYPDPWLFMMAWHTPLIFGSAGVAMLISQLALDRVFKRTAPAHRWTTILAAVIVFGVFYALSGFWHAPTVYRALVITVGAIAVGFWLDPHPLGFFSAAITGLCGCVVESIMHHYGVFQHAQIDFWNVPYWLAPLYFIASFTVGALGRKMVAT